MFQNLYKSYKMMEINEVRIVNPKETRIRILDLQDQYCQICEYQANSVVHVVLCVIN